MDYFDNVMQGMSFVVSIQGQISGPGGAGPAEPQLEEVVVQGKPTTSDSATIESTNAPIIPNPNGVVPGGPWKPAGPGQRPGTFNGPKPPKGPRPTVNWVPPEGEGGPPGSEGYWRRVINGVKQRFNPLGDPITPEEAHPGNRPIPPIIPRSVPPLFIIDLCRLDPYLYVCGPMQDDPQGT